MSKSEKDKKIQDIIDENEKDKGNKIAHGTHPLSKDDKTVSDLINSVGGGGLSHEEKIEDPDSAKEANKGQSDLKKENEDDEDADEKPKSKKKGGHGHGQAQLASEHRQVLQLQAGRVRQPAEGDEATSQLHRDGAGLGWRALQLREVDWQVHGADCALLLRSVCGRT